jgi:predicted adenylyl cyclase CyaB
MSRNIEIKASVESVHALMPKVAAIADGNPVVIVQDDTFFVCVHGRLKLRTFCQERGELIFYRRNDQSGPKESFYLRSPTSDPETMREALRLAYGEAGRVKKRRTLYMIGRTRVHLDEVSGLGDFLELEVVLEEGESVEAGVREADDIMSRLGIVPSQLIEGGYVDLLRSRRGAAAQNRA